MRLPIPDWRTPRRRQWSRPSAELAGPAENDAAASELGIADFLRKRWQPPCVFVARSAASDAVEQSSPIAPILGADQTGATEGIGKQYYSGFDQTTFERWAFGNAPELSGPLPHAPLLVEEFRVCVWSIPMRPDLFLILQTPPSARLFTLNTSYANIGSDSPGICERQPRFNQRQERSFVLMPSPARIFWCPQSRFDRL